MNNFNDIKVAVAGTGYVGLSIATLLSQHHHVTAVDVIPEKVRVCHKSVTHPFLFFSFSQIRNL